MSTLTVEDTDRFPSDLRAEFHAWLDAEGLTPEWIVEGRFGEGVLEAKCIQRGEDGEAVWDDETDEPCYVERTFKLTTPPPEGILSYAHTRGA